MAIVLAPLVAYDDYNGVGYLLDMRSGVLHELNERDTSILNALLRATRGTEAVHSLSTQGEDEKREMDVSALLERLENLRLLLKEDIGPPSNLPHLHASPENENTHRRIPIRRPITLKQRLGGTSQILSVLNELRKREEGFYKAYCYIYQLKERWGVTDIQESALEQTAFQLIREEYWCYRLVTGIIERRIAHLLGQVPGGEGLCMIRAFALCAYLLTLGIPARIVIARPKYGLRGSFKLHVWTELCGKPLNEVLNIRDRYRVITEFPSYP